MWNDGDWSTALTMWPQLFRSLPHAASGHSSGKIHNDYEERLFMCLRSVWDSYLEYVGLTESGTMESCNGPARFYSLSHLLSRQCVSLFGHMAWLGDDTPVNMAVRLHDDTSLSRPPCPPGQPGNKWIDQLRDGHSIRDLWRHSVSRGHGGAMTRQPSPAKRPR